MIRRRQRAVPTPAGARALARTPAPILAVFLAFVFSPALVPPLLAERPPGDAPFGTSLRNYLAQPAFQHATWGLAVHDALSGRVLFETNSHQLLKPASNAKLFTGALALHSLGPGTRLATDLVPSGRITRRGVLRGDLVIQGGGDFSLAARFHDGPPTRSLQPVVDALRHAGLRRIDGDLVADDSLFTGSPFGNGWTWDDLRYSYGAEVSALSLDDNVLDLEFFPGSTTNDPVRLVPGPGASYFTFQTKDLKTTSAGSFRNIRVERSPGSRVVDCSGSMPVGSQSWKDAVTIPEPALYFVHRLREELAAGGIRVRGTARRESGTRLTFPDRPSRAIPISVLSPPIEALVAAMMKPSQNLYAQALLLQVGARRPHPPHWTTEEAGVAALDDFLDLAGIPRREVRLDDGSGLSRSSLVTPAAIVALLQFMDRHPHREAFLNALPVAGRDGTLRNRFKESPIEGNLRAKTGTLRYVHALSGFVTNTDGQRLVFSALLNAYDPPPDAPSGRAALDAVATLLAQSSGLESP